MRNCTLDVNPNTEWCQVENGCEMCSKPGCNNQNVRFHCCLVCQSDVNGNCGVISNAAEHGEQCDSSATYPYSKSGCYTIFKGIYYKSREKTLQTQKYLNFQFISDGNVNRGCLSNLKGDDYENCHQNISCTVCRGDLCNSESISSAVKTSINIFLCLLITFFMINLNSIN